MGGGSQGLVSVQLNRTGDIIGMRVKESGERGWAVIDSRSCLAIVSHLGSTRQFTAVVVAQKKMFINRT